MIGFETLFAYLLSAWPYAQEFGFQIFCALAVLGGLRTFKKRRRPRGRSRNQARWRVRSSGTQLDVLSNISNPAFAFKYLRERIDPYMFEEMILTAYKRKGYKIKRNKRYSGDGGIDGRVRIKGDWHLIQAKRYQSAIRPSDVQKFSAVCRKHDKPGLFIHTGRTGPSSRALEQQCPRVTFVSGDTLLKLMLK